MKPIRSLFLFAVSASLLASCNQNRRAPSNRGLIPFPASPEQLKAPDPQEAQPHSTSAEGASGPDGGVDGESGKEGSGPKGRPWGVMACSLEPLQPSPEAGPEGRVEKGTGGFNLDLAGKGALGDLAVAVKRDADNNVFTIRMSSRKSGELLARSQVQLATHAQDFVLESLKGKARVSCSARDSLLPFKPHGELSRLAPKIKTRFQCRFGHVQDEKNWVDLSTSDEAFALQGRGKAATHSLEAKEEEVGELKVFQLWIREASSGLLVAHSQVVTESAPARLLVERAGRRGICYLGR